MLRKSYINATGSYLPATKLTNHDLEQLVDTSNEWIVTRTGIEERRIAAATEFSSDMGAKAARLALQKAGLSVQDIDAIIVATMSPDYLFPSTACLIQEQLNAPQVEAFDLQAACSGFLYSMSVARAMVESGAKDCVLVVTTEKLSSIIDYEDRSTCVIFGDGSAAFIVSSKATGLAIEQLQLGADGSKAHLLMMPAGGCRLPTSKETVAARQHFLRMSGAEVFKHAVLMMEKSCKQCLTKHLLQEEDINWLIPHQANMRIIDAIAKRFPHLPSQNICKTIQKYGNTSCASNGIALDELWRAGKINAAEYILVTAFGAGFTWGACLLQAVEEL